MTDYVQGLVFAVLGGSLITAVAFVVAIPLGVWAASGPRNVDTALRFVCDLVSSVPTLFVAAVLWAWAGRSLSYVCALGALRGLQQAWLLRCELVRLQAEDVDAGASIFHPSPLPVVSRLRLRAALGPLLVSASFGVAWLTALDAGLTQAGLRPPAAMLTWGIALGARSPKPFTALLTAGSVVVLTVALQRLFRQRRLI